MKLSKYFPCVLAVFALVWSRVTNKRHVLKYDQKTFPLWDMKMKSPSCVSCATTSNMHKICSYYSYNDDDNLCMIHSNLQGETTLISDLQWRIYEPAYSYWIWATDFETEGVWKWDTSQTVVTVTDWSPSQPDNYRGNQDCVQITKTKGYRWDDNLCEALRAFICKMPKLKQIAQ